MENKTDAAYDALMEKIVEKAAGANYSQLEMLARAFRHVAGGAQPGGGCNCHK